MVIENITQVEVFDVLLKKLSSMTTVFQAIGGLVLAYIIFNVINMITHRKKRNELRRIRELLEQINKKLDKKK